LKTFNVNPHTNKNEPTNYQSFKTAINFAKRTKINDEKQFDRLEKKLKKTLGLDAKNESLK
jgi:hypothetical protein